MPSSVKRAAEYGDDLTVLFVEGSSKSDLDEVEAFAYGKHWMGTPAKWTKERPFGSGRKTIPTFVLLSAQGRVLLKGNPIAMEKELDEAIRSEIALAKAAPDDLPRSLKKAWEESVKGEFGKALAEAIAVRDKGGEDVAAAEKLLERVEGEVQRKMQQARWCIENGYPLEADEHLARLSKVLKKSAAHEEALSSLAAALAAQPKEELKAAQALAKVQQKLYEDGLTTKLVRELERVAKHHAGTRAAERAEHLARLGD